MFNILVSLDIGFISCHCIPHRNYYCYQIEISNGTGNPRIVGDRLVSAVDTSRDVLLSDLWLLEGMRFDLVRLSEVLIIELMHDLASLYLLPE